MFGLLHKKEELVPFEIGLKISFSNLKFLVFLLNVVKKYLFLITRSRFFKQKKNRVLYKKNLKK